MPTRLFSETPEGWEEAPLGELFSLRKTLLSDLRNHSVISREVAEEVLVDGDVLLKLSADGAVVIDRSQAEGVKMPCMVLTSNGRMEVGYLRALLENPLVFRRIEQGNFGRHALGLAVHATGLRGWNALKEVVVPVPPPEVQAATVGFVEGPIGTVNKLAQRHRKLADTLERFGRAIGLQMLSGTIGKTEARDLVQKMVTGQQEIMVEAVEGYAQRTPISESSRGPKPG